MVIKEYVNGVTHRLFLIVLGQQWRFIAQWNKLSGFDYADKYLLVGSVFCFGLFMGFGDNKKNIQQALPYPLN